MSNLSKVRGKDVTTYDGELDPSSGTTRYLDHEFGYQKTRPH